MSECGRGTGGHLAGLLAAAVAGAAIVLLWRHGLGFLNGTAFEELRYVIFASVSVGLLSGLNALLARLKR
jgi:hypothetical protein